MGTRTILRKLTHLCTALSTISQIDPAIRVEMEQIPEGTRVEFLIPLSHSRNPIAFIKEDYKFVPLEGLEDIVPTVTFRILTRKTAQQLFAGNLNLIQAITKEDITVKGAPPIALAIIRALQLSFPYTIGLRKTRTIVPSFTRPLHFQRRRITYNVLKIFPIKKRPAVEKVT